jgi:hypothetical protein
VADYVGGGPAALDFTDFAACVQNPKLGLVHLALTIDFLAALAGTVAQQLEQLTLQRHDLSFQPKRRLHRAGIRGSGDTGPAGPSRTEWWSTHDLWTADPQ